jgi:hypothetical protein
VRFKSREGGVIELPGAEIFERYLKRRLASSRYRNRAGGFVMS